MTTKNTTPKTVEKTTEAHADTATDAPSTGNIVEWLDDSGSRRWSVAEHIPAGAKNVK